ncbi:hypothetical protein ACFYWU_33805 [Streptomyces chrestomyceticus]|uniref:hypothetical protein n=1 Tax=Streptomyces chrestomyceticus TaxID=68185 RepID=UPI0036CAED12
MPLAKPSAPAVPPADALTEAWDDTGALPPVPATGPAVVADRDDLADAWSLTPPASAAGPGEANTTSTETFLTTVVPVDDDQAVVGLRDAHNRHLPDNTLAALRHARAHDPAFPASADKRGTELLYRVGALKKWARNRPRAASGTTDLD